MVVGYVIMRVPMLFQWLRAGREDPARREVCKVMAGTLLVAQVGWILLLLADLTTGWMFFVVGLLVLLRDLRPGGRGDQARRHAVARPPHRRAVRPDGDHRPR